MMQIQLFMTKGKKAMMDLVRILHERQRKIISLLIAVTFVFSMTGIDVILAHAFDDTRHDNYNSLDDLHSPANPLAENNPDAFVDINTDTKSDEPVISDTQLNVLKSEYGDLLNTVSLQTVAEQSSGGMNLETAVLNVLQDQGQLPEGGGQPATEDAETQMPEIDPSLIAEATTTGQGPLSFTLELGSMDIGVRQGDEGGSEIVRLPVPVVAVQEDELPQPETAGTEPEVAETNEGTLTAGTTENQNQPDVLVTQNEQDDQSGTPPPDTQPETQEPAVDVPDEQDGETAAETAETEKKEESGGTLADLANEFLARLGLGQDEQKDDTVSVEDAENKDNEAETVATEEGQEDGQETVGEQTETLEDAVVAEGEEGEQEGETVPNTDEDKEDGEMLPEDESPQEIAAKDEDGEKESDVEGTEDEETLPDMITALLVGEDEGEPEGEVDTELLESILDEAPEDEMGTPEEGNDEGEVDITALLDEMGVELDNEGMPAEAEEISSVLIDEENAPDEDQGEEAVEEDDGEQDVLVTNTDSEHAEEDETSMVGPETTLEDEQAAKEDEEQTEDGEQKPDESVDAATVAKENDVLEKDLSEYTKEASAVNVLKSMQLDLPSGQEAGYMKKLSTSFKDGLDIITGNNQMDTKLLKGTDTGVDPKNLDIPEEIGMAPQELPEQIDINMKLVMDKVKGEIKQGKDEVSRLKLMSVMAVSGLLEEGNGAPDAPDVDTDPEYQNWTGNHGVSGTDPWSISEMYGHPEPPKEEQPDPECTDYLSFGIVVLIFGVFVEFENFLENPSWETFGEFMWAMFDPVGHMIYELVNFDWDEFANYGEFAQSPLGKIIMFIITIILTIVTFGSAAPILIAIIILIELIQMFVPLPKWLDIALSIVKAALGGWASAIKEFIKEAVITTIKELIATLFGEFAKDIIKSIIKSVIKEAIMQILAEVLPDDFMIVRTLLSLAADVLANGLAEFLVEGTGESFMDGLLDGLKNIFGLNDTRDMSTLIKVLSSQAVRAIVSVCIQVAILEDHGSNVAQGMMAGAIWGAAASGTLGYIGASAGTRISTDFMDEFMMAFTQIAAPVVSASLSTFMQLYGSKANEDAGFQRNQTMLMGDILSSFGSSMIGTYSPGANGGYSNLVTQVMEMVAPMSGGSVSLGDVSAAQEMKEGDGEGEGDGKGNKDGKNKGEGDGTVKGSSVGNNVGANNVISDIDGAITNNGNMQVDNAAKAATSEPIEAELELDTDDSDVDTSSNNSRSSNIDPNMRSSESSKGAQHHGMQSQQQKSENIPEQKAEIKKPEPQMNNKTEQTAVEQPKLQNDNKDAAAAMYTAPPETNHDQTLTGNSESLDNRESVADNSMRDNKPQNDPKNVEVKDLDKKLPGKTIAEEQLHDGDTVVDETGRRNDEKKGTTANINSSGGKGEGGNEGGGGKGVGGGTGEAIETTSTGTEVTGTTNMAAMNLNQQLQQSAATGNLPDSHQAKAGSTVNSSVMSSGMAKDQSNLQPAMRALEEANAMPVGNSSLKVETFTNDNDNSVTTISKVNTDGSSTLLAASETIGDQTLTTVYKPNGNGSTTASTFAGDANSAKKIGGDVDVSRNLTEGFTPTAERGLDSSDAGQRIPSRDDKRTGDKIEHVSDVDTVKGGKAEGPAYDESGKLLKPGQGDEVSLGAAGNSTIQGGGKSGDTNTVSGTTAGGGKVDVSVDGSGNVKVNGTSEALQNLIDKGSETITLPNGETATLQYDAGTGKVSVNGSSSALQSLQGNSGTGGSKAPRVMDVKLPNGENTTVSIDNGGNVSMTGNPDVIEGFKANGGGSMDVTLPNGQQAKIDVDAQGNMKMTGSMEGLGSAMANANRAGGVLADMAGKEVSLKMKDGSTVTGTVSPDGNQLLLNQDQADALNPGGGENRTAGLPQDMQITMPDGTKVTASVSSDGRQINLSQSGDPNRNGGGGGSGKATLADQSTAGDNPLNPSENAQKTIKGSEDKPHYQGGIQKADPNNLADGQQIIQKEVPWTHKIPILGKVFAIGSNGYQAIQQTMTISVEGQDLNLTFEPLFGVNATNPKTFQATDQFGNKFMVTVKPDGQVLSVSREIRIGSWYHFTAAYETVYSSTPNGLGPGTAVNYDENGEVYQIYQQDPKTGEWIKTHQRDYAKSDGGMPVSALLDNQSMQLPSGARQALILSMNANQNLIMQNPYFNKIMEAKGIRPGTQAYRDEVKAMTMSMASQGVQAAQTYLTMVKTELAQDQTVPSITQDNRFKTAVAVLAQTQVVQYRMDNSTVSVGTIVSNARMGNDPFVMLQAANLQLAGNDKAGAQITADIAMRYISTMPDGILKADAALQVMQVLNQAGMQNSPQFNAAVNIVRGQIVNNPTPENVGLAMRLNTLAGKEVIASADIVEMTNKISAAVNAKMNDLKPGESVQLGEMGTLTRGLDGRLSLTQKNGDQSVSLTFTPENANQINGPVTVGSMMVANAQGVHTTFQMKNGYLEQASQSITIQTVIDGKTVTRDVTIQNEMIKDGSVVTTFQEDGRIFTVTVNTDTRQGQTMVAFDQGQAPADLIGKNNRVSMAYEDGKPVVYVDGQKVEATLLSQVAPEQLTALGISPSMASIIANNLQGKPAVMAPDGTLYIGTEADFESGNYYTAGKNTFPGPDGTTVDVGYFAQYSNGVINRVDTSDGYIYSFLNNDTKNYTVTKYSDDGQRVQVGLYENGQFVGYKITYADLGNVTLTYDSQGNITADCMQKLQNGEMGGVVFNMTPGQGFTLTDPQSGKQYQFSMNGRRTVPSESSASGGGVQEVMEFDTMQKRVLNVAQYNNDKGVSITSYIRTKNSVVVSVGKDGTVSRIITQTDIFTNHLVQRTESFVKDPLTGSMTWQLQRLVGSEADIQAYLQNAKMAPSPVFNQLRSQGGQARLVGGVQYTNANGLYTVNISYGDDGTPKYGLTGIMQTPYGKITVTAGMDNNGILVANSAIGKYEALRFAGIGRVEVEKARNGEGMIGENHVNYETDGTFTVNIGQNRETNAVEYSLVGVLNTKDGDITVMAAMEQGKLVSQTAIGTQEALKTANIVDVEAELTEGAKTAGSNNVPVSYTDSKGNYTVSLDHRNNQHSLIGRATVEVTRNGKTEKEDITVIASRSVKHAGPAIPANAEFEITISQYRGSREALNAAGIVNLNETLTADAMKVGNADVQYADYEGKYSVSVGGDGSLSLIGTAVVDVDGTKEKITIIAGLMTKTVPDPTDPTKTVQKKVFEAQQAVGSAAALRQAGILDIDSKLREQARKIGDQEVTYQNERGQYSVALSSDGRHNVIGHIATTYEKDGVTYTENVSVVAGFLTEDTNMSGLLYAVQARGTREGLRAAHVVDLFQTLGSRANVTTGNKTLDVDYANADGTYSVGLAQDGRHSLQGKIGDVTIVAQLNSDKTNFIAVQSSGTQEAYLEAGIIDMRQALQGAAFKLTGTDRWASAQYQKDGKYTLALNENGQHAIQGWNGGVQITSVLNAAGTAFTARQASGPLAEMQRIGLINAEAWERSGDLTQLKNDNGIVLDTKLQLETDGKAMMILDNTNGHALVAKMKVEYLDGTSEEIDFMIAFSAADVYEQTAAKYSVVQFQGSERAISYANLVDIRNKMGDDARIAIGSGGQQHTVVYEKEGKYTFAYNKDGRHTAIGSITVRVPVTADGVTTFQDKTIQVYAGLNEARTAFVIQQYKGPGDALIAAGLADKHIRMEMMHEGQTYASGHERYEVKYTDEAGNYTVNVGYDSEKGETTYSLIGTITIDRATVRGRITIVSSLDATGHLMVNTAVGRADVLKAAGIAIAEVDGALAGEGQIKGKAEVEYVRDGKMTVNIGLEGGKNKYTLIGYITTIHGDITVLASINKEGEPLKATTAMGTAAQLRAANIAKDQVNGAESGSFLSRHINNEHANRLEWTRDGKYTVSIGEDDKGDPTFNLIGRLRTSEGDITVIGGMQPVDAESEKLEFRAVTAIGKEAALRAANIAVRDINAANRGEGQKIDGLSGTVQYRKEDGTYTVSLGKNTDYATDLLTYSLVGTLESGGRTISVVGDLDNGTLSYSRTEMVNGREVTLQITQSADGNSIVVNGDQENAISMSRGMTIRTTSDNQLLIQDDRSVKIFLDSTGKDVTSNWQAVKNGWHKFTDTVVKAWDSMVTNIAENFKFSWNEFDGWAAFGMCVLSTLAAVGEIVIFLAKTVVAVLVPVLQIVGAIIGFIVENSMNYSLTGMIYENITGEKMGDIAIKGMKDGIKWFDKHVMNPAFKWIKDGCMEIAAFYMEGAEAAFAQGGFWGNVMGGLGTFYAALFIVIGENAPIIILMALSAIPGAGSVFAILGMAMLAKDAILHGLDGMLQTFFVDPFKRVAGGIEMIIQAANGDHEFSGRISMARIIMRASANIGGGVIGIALAYMMIKAPMQMAREARGAKILDRAGVKEYIKTKLEKPGGAAELANKTMAEIVTDAMSAQNGKFSPKAIETASAKFGNTKLGQMKFGDLSISTASGTLSIAELANSGLNGRSVLRSVFEAKDFSFSKMKVKAEVINEKAAQRASKRGKPLPDKAVTELIKASDLGMSRFTGTATMVVQFFVAIGKHQVESFQNAAKMFKSWVVKIVPTVKSVVSSAVSAVRSAVSKGLSGYTAKQVIRAQNEATAAAGTMKSANQRVSDIKSGINDTMNKISEARKAGNQAQVKELQGKLVEQRQALNQARAEAKVAETRAAQAEAKVADMQARVSQRLEAANQRATAAREQARSLAQEKAGLEKNVADLERSLSEAIEAKDMSKAEAVEGEIASLKKQIALKEAEINLSNAEAKIADTEAKLAQNEQKLQSTESRSASAENLLRAENRSLQAEVKEAKAQSEMAKAEAQIAKANSQIADAKNFDQVKKALQKKAEAGQSMRSMEKELKNAAKELDTSKVKEVKAKVKDLMEKVATDKALNPEGRTSRQLERALDKAAKEMGGTKAEQAAFKEQIAEMMASGGDGAKLEAMFKGEQGMQRLKAMAKNGMGTQAKQVLDKLAETDSFKQLCEESGVSAADMKAAMAEAMGLEAGKTFIDKVGKTKVDAAMDKVFEAGKKNGESRLMDKAEAKEISQTEQKMLDEAYDELADMNIEGKSVGEVQRGIEQALNKRFGQRLKAETKLSKAERKAFFKDMAKRMTQDQFQKLMKSGDPVQMLKEMKKQMDEQKLTEADRKQSAKEALDKQVQEARDAVPKQVEAARDQAQKAADAQVEQKINEIKNQNGDRAVDQKIVDKLKQDAQLGVDKAVAEAEAAAVKNIEAMQAEALKGNANVAEGASRSLAEMISGKDSHSVRGLQRRAQQVQQARAELRNAIAEHNQATSQKAVERAQAKIDQAQNKLRLAEKTAELKPEASRNNPFSAERAARNNAQVALDTQGLSDVQFDVAKAIEGISDPAVRAEVKQKLEAINDAQAKIAKAQADSAQANRGWRKLFKSKRDAALMDATKTRQDLIAELQKNGYTDHLMRSVQLEGMTAEASLNRVGLQMGHMLGKIRGDLLANKLMVELRKAMPEASAKTLRKLCSEMGRTTEMFGEATVREIIRTKFKGQGVSEAKAIEVMKRQLGENMQYPALEGSQLNAMRQNIIQSLEKTMPELSSQSRTVMAEMVLRFQLDGQYRFFSPDQPMLRFLFRQAELHYMNMELHVKNPALKGLIGEALQLAMGGGKSCSPIALKVAAELFKMNHPGQAVPAQLYMTVSPALVQQILGEHSFGVEIKAKVIEIDAKNVKQGLSDLQKSVEMGEQFTVQLNGREVVVNSQNLKSVISEISKGLASGKMKSLNLRNGDVQGLRDLQRYVEMGDKFTVQLNGKEVVVNAENVQSVMAEIKRSFETGNSKSYQLRNEQIVELTKDSAKSVIENGFQEGKIYVMDNETLKHVVLEMRSNGLSDAQISKLLQKKLGTVAWDEFHAAFHTTDTIIGASGIVPYLSEGAKVQLSKLAMDHIKAYAEVREWFMEKVIDRNTGQVDPAKMNRLFENVESKPGSEVRNQYRFTKEAYLEISRRTGLDYSKSGDMFIIDKMAKVLTSKNGREYTGGLDANGRSVYGTAEGGVGKPNTIFGDQLQAAFTNIEIFLKETGASRTRLSAADFAQKNSAFVDSVIESLVHTTTERVTMMEAMNLLGSQNIVGFSGTFEGVQGTLNAWGKRLVRINNEPVIDLFQVMGNEAYFQVKVGQDVLMLRKNMRTNKVTLEWSSESVMVNKAFVEQLTKLQGEALPNGKTRTQQIVTHNDNPALAEALGKVQEAFIAQGKATQVVEISTETVNAFIKANKIQVSRNSEGVLSEASMKDVVNRMLQHQGGDVIQLVRIDGMAPELWTVAMDSLGKMIQSEIGCMQQRVIFAPKIGEGLNTLAIKAGKGMGNMAGALHQLDMRPLDVYRQAMKRLNVYEEKPGGARDYKRAEGLTGMSLDYNTINNVTRGEARAMSEFISEIRQAMAKGNGRTLEIDIVTIEGKAQLNPESPLTKYFQQFNDMLVGQGAKVNGRVEGTGVAKTILNEVDAQKIDATRKTQAGIQTEETVSVSVEKGSAEYMQELARTVEFNMPKLLRKYQGVSDIVARQVGMPQSASSFLLRQPSFDMNMLRSNGFWNKVPVVGNVLNHIELRTSALETSASKIQLVNEYAKTWQDSKWLSSNADAVAGMQLQYGQDWFNAAMTDKFGADWKLYQSMGTALQMKNMSLPIVGSLFNNLAATVATDVNAFRAPRIAKRQFNQAIRDIVKVNEKLPELRRNEGSTVAYQNRTMNLTDATKFVQQNMVIAQNLAAHYGFKLDPQLAALPARQNVVERQGAMIQELASAQTLANNPVANLIRPISQSWQNVLRTVQKTQMIAPLLKVENGWIKPTTPAKLILGAAFVGLMSLTSLPVTGLAVGVFGMTLMTPVLSKLSPAMAARMASTDAKQKSIGARLAMPLVMMAAGILFASPTVIAGAVGSVHGQVVEHVFQTTEQNIDEAVVTNKAEGEEESAVKGKEAGVDTTATSKGNLLEEWKKRMGDSRNGSQAVTALRELLQERDVDMAVGAVAHHYGYMHMLAAIFSMVPQALESISTVEIAADIQEKSGKAKKQGVRIDQSSIRFLDQRFSDVIMTQTIGLATDRLIPDARYQSMSDVLRNHRMFKEYKNNALVEFMRQFIVDGENLKALCDGDKALQAVYDEVKGYVGREFNSNDVAEIAVASGELENEAFTLMKQKAGEIQTSDEQMRLSKETEFEATFGVSYSAYQEMMTPSLSQRILTRIVGREKLQGGKPVLTVKGMGQQMVGLGASAAIVGLIAALIIGGSIAPVLGGIAALVGLAGMVQGAVAWMQAEKIAFNLNPTKAVQEQLAAASFESVHPRMSADAAKIAQLTGADEFIQRKAFQAQYDMSYEMYRKVSIETLLQDPYFQQALGGLRIAGTEQMVSETMRNRAIRVALQHLLTVVESDVSQEVKLDITRDITKILGFMQFDINMTFKKYADELSVTLTPEVVPRALTQDHKLGRIIKRLESLGIGIKLDIQPIRQQPKLKTTGSAA